MALHETHGGEERTGGGRGTRMKLSRVEVGSKRREGGKGKRKWDGTGEKGLNLCLNVW